MSAAGGTDVETPALGGRMGLGRSPAVVVVDLQLGFTDPASPLGSEATEEVEAANTVIRGARRAGAPIVFTTCRWSPASEVWARKIPAQRTLAAGSRWVELDDRLDRHEDDLVIEKSLASAFFGTSLHDELGRLGVDTVVLLGTTTSGCVRASAVDGCSLGYLVTVPREAVADRDQAAHEGSLRDMDTKYADAVGVEEVLDYFARLARERRP